MQGDATLSALLRLIAAFHPFYGCSCYSLSRPVHPLGSTWFFSSPFPPLFFLAVPLPLVLTCLCDFLFPPCKPRVIRTPTDTPPPLSNLLTLVDFFWSLSTFRGTGVFLCFETCNAEKVLFFFYDGILTLSISPLSCDDV